MLFALSMGLSRLEGVLIVFQGFLWISFFLINDKFKPKAVSIPMPSCLGFAVLSFFAKGLTSPASSRPKAKGPETGSKSLSAGHAFRFSWFRFA